MVRSVRYGRGDEHCSEAAEGGRCVDQEEPDPCLLGSLDFPTINQEVSIPENEAVLAMNTSNKLHSAVKRFHSLFLEYPFRY